MNSYGIGHLNNSTAMGAASAMTGLPQSAPREIASQLQLLEEQTVRNLEMAEQLAQQLQPIVNRGVPHGDAEKTVAPNYATEIGERLAHIADIAERTTRILNSISNNCEL